MDVIAIDIGLTAKHSTPAANSKLHFKIYEEIAQLPFHPNIGLEIKFFNSIVKIIIFSDASILTFNQSFRSF